MGEGRRENGGLQSRYERIALGLLSVGRRGTAALLATIATLFAFRLPLLLRLRRLRRNDLDPHAIELQIDEGERVAVEYLGDVSLERKSSRKGLAGLIERIERRETLAIIRRHEVASAAFATGKPRGIKQHEHEESFRSDGGKHGLILL